MSRRYGFTVHQIRISALYTSDNETLSAVAGHDFIQKLHDHLNVGLTKVTTEIASERIHSTETLALDGRRLAGVIDGGHYGASGRVQDSKSKKPTYKIGVTQGVTMPAFFMVIIPINSERGLLIVQTSKVVPIYTVLTQHMENVTNKLNSNLRVHITPLVTAEAFQELVKGGELQRLSYTRYSIPSDVADKYASGSTAKSGTMTVTFNAPKGKLLPMGKALRELAKDKDAKFEVPGMAQEFEKATAQVRFKGRYRTLKFRNPFAQPVHDLTGELELGPNGHPTFESLVKQVGEVADEYED